MGRDAFRSYVAEVASRFHAVEGPVKLVSNLDADGISAGAIMSATLERLGVEHETWIIHQLREDELETLREEPFSFIIFTDVGSGVLDQVDRILDEKKVLVLDHHEPHGEASNVWHVNPHRFSVDGSSDVSASGVSFLFSYALDDANADLAHLAIVGAIGDVQEDDGFIGLNETIMQVGIDAGVLDVSRGLNLYGRQTRPLYKLLEYSSDLVIPGVTNSESGAVQFLKEIGVDPKDDGEWRYLDDLSPEEHQRLVTGIIMRRRGEDVPEDILSNVYTLPQEEGIFRDAKEFSTLLNACGRLDEAQVGLDACLDRPGARERAVEVKAEYKAEIVRALNWYEDHRESEYVTEGDGYVIINAEENVLNTIVGTIISILSKGGEYSPGTLFLSMARKPDDVTKVSIRVADNPEGVRLNELIAELASHVGGESGGHQYAAGAIIPTSKEEAFISHAVDVFERHTT